MYCRATSGIPARTRGSRGEPTTGTIRYQMQRSVTWRLIASTDAEVEAAPDAFGWPDRSSAGTCSARNGIAADAAPVLAGGLGIRVRIPPRFQRRERNLGG